MTLPGQNIHFDGIAEKQNPVHSVGDVLNWQPNELSLFSTLFSETSLEENVAKKKDVS